LIELPRSQVILLVLSTVILALLAASYSWCGVEYTTESLMSNMFQHFIYRTDRDNCFIEEAQLTLAEQGVSLVHSSHHDATPRHLAFLRDTSLPAGTAQSAY